MTPEQIALVREGFERIAPRAEDVGLAVYQRIFELDLSLRPLFGDDMRPHARNLMGAVAMVVASLDDLTPLLSRIQELGRRHVGYGVKPGDLVTGGVALLAALEAGLGDAFTTEARAAWTVAYTTLADTMMAGMSQALPKAA
jgi:hemoglobin-like flavoprotein